MRRLSSGSIRNVRTFLLIIAVAAQMLSAQSSPHGPLKQACTDCHTTSSWKDLAVPMRFNHATTGFLLPRPILRVSSATPQNGSPEHRLTASPVIRRISAKRCPPSSGGTLHTNVSHATPSTAGVLPSLNIRRRISNLSALMHPLNVLPAIRTIGTGIERGLFLVSSKGLCCIKHPNHSAGQFSRECLSCHTINTWQPSSFDHNNSHSPALAQSNCRSLACAAARGS